MVALVAVVLGARYINRDEPQPVVPPLAVPMESGEPSVPLVEDPRSHPAFDEAYNTVCAQTLLGLDVVIASGETADLVPLVTNEQQLLESRIASVYDREDLWEATDPLVLEFAETIADDLASIVDGTDVGLSYLQGDVTLFRSLCDDWFAPL